MIKKESSLSIVSSIFYRYIFNNPVCRSLMLPVLFIMVIAKYIEVLGASQSEKLTHMIQKGERDVYVLLRFSLINISIILLVEIQAFIICKAGQLGYRIANRDAFKFYLDLSPEDFSKTGKGEIQNIVSRKSQAVQDMIDVCTLNFFPTFLTMVFASYAVFNRMGFSTAILINIGVFCYAFVTIKITEWRNNMRKRLNSAQNTAANIMIDGLYNYETVFTYKSSDIEVLKYNQTLKGVEKNSTELARSIYLLNLAQKSVWYFMTLIIIIKSCFGPGSMIKTEKFVFLTSIISIIMGSMDNLGYMYGKFKTALLNSGVGNTEYEPHISNGYRTISKLNHEIELKDLSVQIGHKTIFENLTYNIKKGDKVAIIGQNGSGKSTLLKSFVNLNKYHGEILIDGVNVNEITERSLIGLITYIPQNPILFNDTVMSNIKYGNAKLLDEDVYIMSKALGIHNSILRLNKGYFSNVGEQGKSLSGGERQKIIVLRAVLRRPAIILMDEPTASVDKNSEMEIIKTIVGIEGLTVITIVHNFELLRMFNRVLKIGDNSILDELKDHDISDIDIMPKKKAEKA